MLHYRSILGDNYNHIFIALSRFYSKYGAGVTERVGSVPFSMVIPKGS